MGQVRAGGVRQDLLDDRRHHSLVVAVPAARATGSGDTKSGKKRASAQSPESHPTPTPPVSPRLFSLPSFTWEEVGLSYLQTRSRD